MQKAVTRYAKNGDTAIAYQVVGHGSFDLLMVPAFPSNLEILWEDPGYSRLAKRLSAFCRLILFDPRGSGLSDRIGPLAAHDPQTRMADINAVLDATGCGRAALLGSSDGAAQAIQFAASYPQRTRALILHGYAGLTKTASDEKGLRAQDDAIRTSWGTGTSLARLAPGRVDDRALVEWWGRLERLSASPTAAAVQMRLSAATDFREAVTTVEAPTLLINRTGDAHSGEQGSRQPLRVLKHARLVELPGRDHPVWMGDVDRVADLIEEFLTGERSVADGDRVLAALLVGRIIGTSAVAGTAAGRHLQERIELFREALPKMVARHGGEAQWSGSDRFDARFSSAVRAVGCAVALREAAASLGLTVAQGIHAGEIYTALPGFSGQAVDVADQIAGSARHPDILLSRLAISLVSGSGMHFVDRGALVLDGLHEPLHIAALASERHLEPASRGKPRPADLGVLSTREREVLGLVADGLSNPHIAVQLGLSEHTVKRHVANILLKLDMPTRAAAAGLVARASAG